MPSLDMSVAVHMVRNGGFTAVIDSGILADHLFDDGRKIYEFTRSHFAQFGKVPDAATILTDLKIEVPPSSDVVEPVAYFIDRIKSRALDKLAKEHAKAATAAMDRVDSKGVIDAAKELLTAISQQNLAGEVIDDWTLNTGERIAEYEAAKTAQGGVTGIPTPWTSLNDRTQGINKGDFWILCGRPGSGKSWAVSKMVIHAWVNDFKPLFVSLEMPVKKIKRRMDAIYARLAYYDFKRGKLGMHIEAQYKQALDGLEEKPPLNIVTRKRVKTVGDVALLMEQLQPSVVFIDGLYKLRPNSVNKYKSNWEVIMALVDEIQELALEKEIPIVGVTQLNRGAAKQKGKKSSSAAGLEDIAFADAIGMNADVILGLLPTEETKGRNETVIQLMKNREDDIGSWLVKFDLAAMDFNEVGPYQEPSDDPDDASVGYAP